MDVGATGPLLAAARSPDRFTGLRRDNERSPRGLELFRVDPDGETATRIEVRLGRASVSSIEVIEGLVEGDRIVVSDTRRWDDHNRLSFK